VADWRPLCDVDPISLPADVVEAVSAMYAAGTNAYTGREWFDAPSVESAVETIRNI